MPDLITDGDFSTAKNISGLRYSAPFAQYGISNLYVVEQDFVINESSFSPLAVDTAHPTLPGFFLATESAYQHVSVNNTVKWTRRYAQVPSSFSRPGGTYNFTYPVMINPAGAFVDTGSRLQPKTLTVPCRVLTEFIHTSDPDSISVIEAQRFVLALYPAIDATSPFGQPAVSDLTTFSVATSPSFTTYNAWIAGGIEFVAEASKITPNWMGNIHMRETTYIKAK